tara:strand:+ start:3921 stop:4982 length:1062 start_codon:yes stop_codon:yes gene_type:complete
MEPDIINDIRKDFKNITFSKFQKSKAKQELLNCIYNCKIENACYWCAEFICAGHFLDLWDIIIIYYCKFIHCANPKLPIYLNMRYDNFLSIINSGYSTNILVLRNNKKMRKLFAEIICILCYSNKKHTYNDVKLNKTYEFDLTVISEKFRAPNMNYCDSIFKEDDPKELFIPLNELIYNLENKNIVETCYWYEWIIEYEAICKKKKKKCICQARSYAPSGFYNDIIWIIWDIIYHYGKNIEIISDYSAVYKNIIIKIIDSLYKLFVIKYNSSFKRKRKYILYFCFSILIEKINIDVAFTNKTNEINAITEKIDNIYKDIKKNEVSPKTDYLFKNIKKTNLEKTIEKIDLINNL